MTLQKPTTIPSNSEQPTDLALQVFLRSDPAMLRTQHGLHIENFPLSTGLGFLIGLLAAVLASLLSGMSLF